VQRPVAESGERFRSAIREFFNVPIIGVENKQLDVNGSLQRQHVFTPLQPDGMVLGVPRAICVFLYLYSRAVNKPLC